jgi:hypothetical protein
VDTSGGSVDSVADLIGGIYPLTNTAAARPTYTASDADFNGEPSCTNNGTAQYLFNSGALANTLCGGNDRAFSVYLVMRFITIPAALAGIVCTSEFISGSRKDALCHSAATSMQNLRQSGDVQTAPVGGTPATGTTYLIRKHFVANATTVKLNAVTAINAVAQDQADMTSALNRFSVGALMISGAAGFFANIKWSELFVCLGQPTVDEDTALGAYFGTKYNFSAG